MIEIEGRQIPSTIEELVDPKHAALICIDMQNDICSPGGREDKMGRDYRSCAAILPTVAKVQAAARKAGVFIIHTQSSTYPDHRSDSPAWLRFKYRNYIPEGETDFSLPGSWGDAFADEVKPRKGDLTIRKVRPDAFVATDLDLLLRCNGMRTVVLTGVVTQGCVEATARGAAYHDYFVVVLKDCVASTVKKYHDASLMMMDYRFDVASAEEAIGAWSKVIRAAGTKGRC
ncbi:MAG: isochorismatase family cysteine hydrolase [Chloroflexota bacterium]